MNFLEKIKSRKFIASMVGLIMGLAIVFGLDESTIGTVSGAVVSLASVLTYIVTEGKIDEEALNFSQVKENNFSQKAENIK